MVLAKLSEHLRPVVTFAYHTGWRIRSEVLRLTWAQADLTIGTVRLEVGDTKNKDGRLLYLTTELHALLTEQWQNQQTCYPDCPFVFHDHGKQVKTFYKSRRKACQAAGIPGKLGHDFRRTAVRNYGTSRDFREGFYTAIGTPNPVRFRSLSYCV